MDFDDFCVKYLLQVKSLHNKLLEIFPYSKMAEFSDCVIEIMQDTLLLINVGYSVHQLIQFSQINLSNEDLFLYLSCVEFYLTGLSIDEEFSKGEKILATVWSQCYWWYIFKDNTINLNLLQFIKKLNKIIENETLILLISNENLNEKSNLNLNSNSNEIKKVKNRSKNKINKGIMKKYYFNIGCKILELEPEHFDFY